MIFLHFDLETDWGFFCLFGFVGFFFSVASFYRYRYKLQNWHLIYSEIYFTFFIIL